MVRCCVPSCTTYQGRGIKLYRIPTDIQRRNQFVEQIQRPNWSPSKNARICEKHFRVIPDILEDLDPKKFSFVAQVRCIFVGMFLEKPSQHPR